MERKLWNQLPGAYPQLFSTIEPPSFECNDGWVGIVSVLCQRLITIRDENPGTEITIDRIKQKFGMLRIHLRVHGAKPDLRAEILDAVDLATKASEQCCEICAAVGKSYFGPPSKVRCNACIDL